MQPRFIWIDDLCNLKHYYIDPSKRLVNVMKIDLPSGQEGPLCDEQHMSVEDARRISQAPATKYGAESLGHSPFNGLDAFGWRTAVYGSDEDRGARLNPVSSDERWCSPELGVVMGLYRHDTKANHEVKIVMKHVSRTEPDAVLFTIPADYTQVEVNPDGTPVKTPGASAHNTNP